MHSAQGSAMAERPQALAQKVALLRCSSTVCPFPSCVTQHSPPP